MSADRGCRGHAGRAFAPATTPRCASQLSGELGLSNIMQVPRLEKIVINMGVGRATQQQSLLEGAVKDMTAIAGQKPVVTKARQSIAGFKLRQGNAIGCMVTLRGDRMWEFLDRLISLAIPRIRDFRGSLAAQLRRPRQLHLRCDRAADLPGDQLRQDRFDPRDGHHDRDVRPYRRRRPSLAVGLRVPIPTRRAVSRLWPRRH